MITRCRCGKLASTKRPCKVCLSPWPMHHCHNRKHANHVRTVMELDGDLRLVYWPVDYDDEKLPLEVDGECNPDLEPCYHLHPYDDYDHWNEPHHEVQEPQRT